jgi:hypothetical protein
MVSRDMLCKKARSLANFDVRGVGGFGQNLKEQKALVLIAEVGGGTTYWVASEGYDGKADCVDLEFLARESNEVREFAWSDRMNACHKNPNVNPCDPAMKRAISLYLRG